MKTSNFSYGFVGTFLLIMFGLQWWQLPAYPLWFTGCLISLIVIGIILSMNLCKTLIEPRNIASSKEEKEPLKNRLMRGSKPKFREAYRRTLSEILAKLTKQEAFFRGSSTLRQCRGVGIMLIACSLGALIAILNVARTTHVTTKEDVEYYADGETHELHGQVIDAPDVRPTVTKLTVLADHVSSADGTMVPVTGRVLVNDSGGWPEHPYGQWVTIWGTLEKPAPIETFAYDEYLSVRAIYAIMPRAKVQRAQGDAVQARTAIEWLTGAIFRLRTHFEYQINRVFPEPHASLLAGLITGSRRGIPKHLTDDFRAAGITHIIAISGYNVTIILTLLSGMLFWIPLKKRFLILAAGIILFALFVGGSAPVVRASIMGILGLLALQTGRQTSVFLSILWTAFFMLAWNPKELWYDAGFQLSFLAIIGLALLSDPLKKLFRKVPETLALRESLTATIAAQIATLPLTMILFRQISLIAPLSNMLVAPLIPIAMLIGFVATVVSAVWMPLGLVIGYAGWAVLQAIILIAQVCAQLPFAVVTF